MLTFVVYLAIAAFIGLAILGHIFVLQAIFISADHADGKHEKKHAPRSFLPDVPV
jgi:hypothetical protein